MKDKKHVTITEKKLKKKMLIKKYCKVKDHCHYTGKCTQHM